MESWSYDPSPRNPKADHPEPPVRPSRPSNFYSYYKQEERAGVCLGHNWKQMSHYKFWLLSRPEEGLHFVALHLTYPPWSLACCPAQRTATWCVPKDSSGRW